MKTVRKWLAFLLAAGLMVSAMVVFASGGSYGYTEKPYSDPNGLDFTGGGVIMNVPGQEDDGKQYYGYYPPNGVAEGTYWHWMADPDAIGADGKNFGFRYTYTNGQWVRYDGAIYSGGYGSSNSDSKSDESKYVDKYAESVAIAQRAEAEAVQHAASDEGFADVGDMYIAREKSMSAGEFYNNAVVSTPGIENAVTVGQGGGLIVNGEVTNMSASISKVTNRAYVDSLRVEQEGRVLNVVNVSYPAVEATINFYMPGVTAEDAIVALQYNAGTWVEVEVAEVRADHVTLNMKGNGVVAFIAKEIGDF